MDNRLNEIYDLISDNPQITRQYVEEIIEPVYRLYGFEEDEKDFIFTLFIQNMDNDPDHTFTELIIPSPFPFTSGLYSNTGGTSRQGELDGYYREDIEKAKLAHFDKDGKPFVNWTRVWKLHNGAIWQLNEKIERLEQENKELKTAIDKILPES